MSIFLKNLMAFYYDKFYVDFFLILHCTLLNRWAIYGNFLSILFIPCLLYFFDNTFSNNFLNNFIT